MSHHSAIVLLLMVLSLTAVPAAAYWQEEGVVVCHQLSLEQWHPSAVPDGSGGAVIAWYDMRQTTGIYAQRIDRQGQVQWVADGVPVTLMDHTVYWFDMVADGFGGAYLAWSGKNTGETYSDIYVQHLAGDGNVTWQAGGVPICTASGSQDEPCLIDNGVDGIIAAWTDQPPAPVIGISTPRA